MGPLGKGTGRVGAMLELDDQQRLWDQGGAGRLGRDFISSHWRSLERLIELSPASLRR
jgi:hypothetical protein